MKKQLAKASNHDLTGIYPLLNKFKNQCVHLVHAQETWEPYRLVRSVCSFNHPTGFSPSGCHHHELAVLVTLTASLGMLLAAAATCP